MTTLNKYLKHMEIDSTRRLPSDIYRLAEKSLYDELVKTKTKYNKLRTKYNKLVLKLMEE